MHLVDLTPGSDRLPASGRAQGSVKKETLSAKKMKKQGLIECLWVYRSVLAIRSADSLQKTSVLAPE